MSGSLTRSGWKSIRLQDFSLAIPEDWKSADAPEPGSLEILDPNEEVYCTFDVEPAPKDLHAFVNGEIKRVWQPLGMAYLGKEKVTIPGFAEGIRVNLEKKPEGTEVSVFYLPKGNSAVLCGSIFFLCESGLQLFPLFREILTTFQPAGAGSDLTISGKASGERPCQSGLSRGELADQEKLLEVLSFIDRRAFGPAKEMLLAIAEHAPASEFSPTWRETENEIIIKFWNLSEFIHFVDWHKQQGSLKKKVVWQLGVYPQVFYLLGFISVEEGNHSEAMAYFEKAGRYEPENPSIISERAQTYRAIGDLTGSLSWFEKISGIGPFVSPRQFALILRQKGVTLIDMERLDEAESALRESLKFDPGNNLAVSELAYIENLRGGAPKQKLGDPLTTKVGLTQGEIQSRITPRKLDAFHCADCDGVPGIDGDVKVRVIDGRELPLCDGCHAARTKKWWKFWN